MASFFFDKARNSWTCQYKDPDSGKYKAQRIDEKGEPFKRKKDAQQWYHLSGYDIEAGNVKDTGNMSVGEWLTDWHSSYCAEQNLEPNTRRCIYGYIEKHIKPEIGDVRLADVKPHHIRKMLTALLEKKKPSKNPDKAVPLKLSTVRQIYQWFRVAMAQAVEDDMIRKNPCLKVKAPVAAEEKPNYCTAEQIQAMIRKMEGTRFYMPIYLCIMLGLRRGEALALKWDDIEGTTAHIRMQIAVESEYNAQQKKYIRKVSLKKPKTNRSIRDLEIPPDLLAALHKHRKRQLEDKLKLGDLYIDEGFICADEGGGYLSPDSTTVAARNFLKAVGAKDGTHLHDLRHTFGTLTYQAGYPIDVVADLLGDTIAAAQKYYIGEDSKKKRDAALTVNELFKVK